MEVERTPNRSLHTKLTGEENSPNTPAGIQTLTLLIRSPVLLPTSYPSCVISCVTEFERHWLKGTPSKGASWLENIMWNFPFAGLLWCSKPKMHRSACLLENWGALGRNPNSKPRFQISSTTAIFGYATCLQTLWQFCIVAQVASLKQTTLTVSGITVVVAKGNYASSYIKSLEL